MSTVSAKDEKKILIANRGEIAIRIAKSCRELGHTSVGLYTDDEINAPHLQFCDEWVYLSGKTREETYLNKNKIISLAKKHHVDGIHPGYGFLSENPDFVQLLEKEDIVFIGPHKKAIQLMGDKAISKNWAKKVGVPVVPGSQEPVPTVQEAINIAKDISFPILLKAVAGGGGKGMRACYNENDIRHQFESVTREAKSSFGNGDLLVEKLIVNPRHIEVQILADKKGNIYHLFERECSIQRRHQKILEESPSPFIGGDEKLRNDICHAAVTLAASSHYDSVGTVEFIVGEDRTFYFLEMNTRIQVEHPITEELTGIDLIACMIQAAFEEDLGISGQDWIKRMGHAIECRICAEDPITMLPSPGRVTGFETNFPQGIRFDHCLYRGLDITPNFDPMVGKLVARGPIREVAIRKILCALDGLYIEGLKTNIPLHKIILQEKNFKAGHYSTDYIAQVRPQDNINTSMDYDKLYLKLAGIEMRQLKQ